MFAEGGVKGQNCPRGSFGRKLDLKGCNFKPMRGLPESAVTSLLRQLSEGEISIAEMGRECKKVKRLRELQKALMEQTGVKTWDEATEKFPNFANAEALDQFVDGNTKKMITSDRYMSHSSTIILVYTTYQAL